MYILIYIYILHIYVMYIHNIYIYIYIYVSIYALIDRWTDRLIFVFSIFQLMPFCICSDQATPIIGMHLGFFGGFFADVAVVVVASKV